MQRYCATHGLVPANHRCGRWRNPATGENRWIPGWDRTRTLVLAQHPVCTEADCNEPSTEVHHVSDHTFRGVCRTHNPRGG